MLKIVYFLVSKYSKWIHDGLNFDANTPKMVCVKAWFLSDGMKLVSFQNLPVQSTRHIVSSSVWNETNFFSHVCKELFDLTCHSNLKVNFLDAFKFFNECSCRRLDNVKNTFLKHASTFLLVWLPSSLLDNAAVTQSVQKFHYIGLP